MPLTLHQGNTCATLDSEDEFKEFQDTPGVFKHAATHTTAPRDFLRKVQRDIAEMAAEDEFKEFKGTPGIFKHAAKNNPTAPREFLRKVQTGEATYSYSSLGKRSPNPAQSPDNAPAP